MFRRHLDAEEEVKVSSSFPSVPTFTTRLLVGFFVF